MLVGAEHSCFVSMTQRQLGMHHAVCFLFSKQTLQSLCVFFCRSFMELEKNIYIKKKPLFAFFSNRALSPLSSVAMPCIGTGLKSLQLVRGGLKSLSQRARELKLGFQIPAHAALPLDQVESYRDVSCARFGQRMPEPNSRDFFELKTKEEI